MNEYFDCHTLKWISGLHWQDVPNNEPRATNPDKQLLGRRCYKLSCTCATSCQVHVIQVGMYMQRAWYF